LGELQTRTETDTDFEEFQAKFSHISSKSVETTEEYEYFYLWDTHEAVFEIYYLLTFWLDVVVLNSFAGGKVIYRINTLTAIKLLEEKGLTVTDNIKKLSYIHSGYTSIISQE
jgi:hypothetical protein